MITPKVDNVNCCALCILLVHTSMSCLQNFFIFITREAVSYTLFGVICLYVCNTITFECLELESSFLVFMCILRGYRSNSYMKFIGPKGHKSQKPAYKLRVRIFTALHVMQTRYSEENSVCPSVCLSFCLSVRLSHACIVTKRKKDLSRFLYHTKEHLS